MATISRRRHMLPRPAVHQGGLALLDGERRRRAGCARLVAGRDGEQRPGRKGFRRGAAGSGWPAAGGGGRSAHASCRPAAWSDGHGPETRRGAPPSSRPRAPGRHGREQQHRAGRGRRALATHASSPAEATSSGARPTAHASSPAVGGEQRPASHACLRDGRGRGVATVRAIW